ncbi:MAG: hypothetical protein JSR11_07790 [Bacteroidetes bacterium]|nr:hypothetical protein [Bacteroidota bacterium]
MKLLNNNDLYIEFEDLATAISIEEQKKYDKVAIYLRKSNSTENSFLPFIKDPKRRSKVLYDYANMHDRYKKIVEKHFGNPYDFVAKEPIRKLVIKDLTAHNFYLTHKIDGKKLPDLHVEKYTTSASWLNMLAKINEDKSFIKKTLNLTMDVFYLNVCELIKIEKIDLPSSYQRLITKLKEYKEKGYVCLIDWRFGNDNSAKINDKKSEDVLLSLIEHPNQYDDVLIAALYNEWAKKNGYKEITPYAVGNWRRKREDEITTGRYGSSAFNEKYIRQVKGLAPTRVGMLWESDDYNINYYFQTNDKEEDNKLMQRYVSYVVADSRTGLVLGKSYRNAKSPVFEMVKLAWIDAMYYVKRLVNDGNWYIPFEIKADHWNKTNSFPFFKQIAKFIPPAHGNKHRGYIEQMFGNVHLKRCEKLAAHNEINYNGNNVTAANRGVNLEALNDNRFNRPFVGEEAENQIERFFHYLRELPDLKRENLNAPSRKQQWLENWQQLSYEEKNAITDEQFLLLFGFKHEPHGRPITITNRGVEPQINGIEYSYDLPDYVKYQYLIGTKVNVIYDPYDMSRVLITDGEKLRMILRSATLNPRALEDTCINSRYALNMVLNEKKEQVKNTAAKAANRKQIVLDEEAVLLGAFMPKELKNNTELQYETLRAKQIQGDDKWQAEMEEYLDNKNDYNDFFNN